MSWSHASWLRATATTAVVLVAGWRAFVAGQPSTGQPPAAQPPTASDAPQPPVPVSASAQRLYSEARPNLLQVRTLLKKCNATTLDRRNAQCMVPPVVRRNFYAF